MTSSTKVTFLGAIVAAILCGTAVTSSPVAADTSWDWVPPTLNTTPQKVGGVNVTTTASIGTTVFDSQTFRILGNGGEVTWTFATPVSTLKVGYGYIEPYDPQEFSTNRGPVDFATQAVSNTGNLYSGQPQGSPVGNLMRCPDNVTACSGLVELSFPIPITSITSTDMSPGDTANAIGIQLPESQPAPPEAPLELTGARPGSKPLPVAGQTTVVKKAATDHQARLSVKVTCTPKGKRARGDISYCSYTFKQANSGSVLKSIRVKTHGYRRVHVKAVITATPKKKYEGLYSPSTWKRAWIVK